MLEGSRSLIVVMGDFVNGENEGGGEFSVGENGGDSSLVTAWDGRASVGEDKFCGRRFGFGDKVCIWGCRE